MAFLSFSWKNRLCSLATKTNIQPRNITESHEINETGFKKKSGPSLNSVSLRIFDEDPFRELDTAFAFI